MIRKIKRVEKDIRNNPSMIITIPDIDVVDESSEEMGGTVDLLGKPKTYQSLSELIMWLRKNVDIDVATYNSGFGQIDQVYQSFNTLTDVPSIGEPVDGQQVKLFVACYNYGAKVSR